jgi:phage/plasmid-like protein (TIGR03299 family)
MAALVETMFSSNGQVPWHRMGNVLDDSPDSVDEALEAAGLDWDVHMHQMTYETPEGPKAVDDRVAVVRDSDFSCLGIVSPSYNPLQNRQMYTWVQNLMEADPGRWNWETGGSLQNGKVVWGMIHQNTAEVIPGDVVEENLLILTSHNGTKPLCILPTQVRVVCNNTMSAAIYGAQNHDQYMKIKHNSLMEIKLDEAMEIYVQSSEIFKAQRERMARFANVKMTSTQLEEFVDMVIPFDKKSSAKIVAQNELMKLAVVDGKASGAVNLGVTNSLYGAVMGAGEVIEYGMYPRSKDRGNTILFGQGAQKTKEMLKIAEQFYAKVA